VSFLFLQPVKKFILFLALVVFLFAVYSNRAIIASYFVKIAVTVVKDDYSGGGFAGAVKVGVSHLSDSCVMAARFNIESRLRLYRLNHLGVSTFSAASSSWRQAKTYASDITS
jgi:hypothetical protein